MAHPSLDAAAARLKEALRSAGERPIRARVRRAVQSLSVPALGTDDHARLVVANAAALELTGYSERELLQLGVPEITAATDVPHTDILWQAFLRAGEQTGKYDICRKDGTTVTVEYLAMANAAPGIHVSLLRPVSS